jgi:hypothetical protein
MPFQCSGDKARLKMIDLFLQSGAYQFFTTIELFELVQDYAATLPQTFKIGPTCAVSYILVCAAV